MQVRGHCPTFQASFQIKVQFSASHCSVCVAPTRTRALMNSSGMISPTPTTVPIPPRAPFPPSNSVAIQLEVPPRTTRTSSASEVLTASCFRSRKAIVIVIVIVVVDVGVLVVMTR